MRMVFALVLVLGLGLAGFAVYMAQGFMANVTAERNALMAAQANAPRLVDVVVLKKALKYGERFSMTDLDVVKWQEGKVPEGAFALIQAPQGAMMADGQTPIVPAFFEGETRPRSTLRSYEAFEPLLAKKITEPGVDAGIAASMSPGMSAFAINVDVTSGVSGFLRPGNTVDVYWTGTAGETDVTKLLQQAMRLIAVDQSADSDRSEETQIARTVTVEGTREQVALLAQAQSSGRLTLSLVGAGVAAVSAEVQVDQKAVSGVKAPEVVQAEEAPKVCSIRTNKGGEIVETTIPCSN